MGECALDGQRGEVEEDEEEYAPTGAKAAGAEEDRVGGAGVGVVQRRLLRIGVSL
jgi:hypothetical protein